MARRRTGARFRRNPGALGWTLRIGLLVLAVVVIGGGWFAYRLSQGPISSEWLRSQFSLRLAATLGDKYTVQVGCGEIAWDQARGLSTAFADIRLRSEAAGLGVTIRSLRIYPNLSTVLFGRLAVERADVSGLEANLDIIETTPATGDVAFDKASNLRLVRLLDRSVGQIAKRVGDLGFRQISVLDSGFALSHRRGLAEPRRWRFLGIDAEVTLDPARHLVSANLSAAGQTGRWSVELQQKPYEEKADGAAARLSDGHQLIVKGLDITAADFLPLGHKPRRGSALLLPVSPQFAAGFNAAGELEQMGGFLSVGAGIIGMGGEEVVLLDEADIRLSWKQGDRFLAIEQSSLHIGETRFLFVGRMVPPDPGKTRLAFTVSVLEGQIKPRDIEGAPLFIDNILVEGSFLMSSQYLDIAAFRLQTGNTKISGAGGVDLSPRGPTVSMAFNTTSMHVETFKRLWPSFYDPETRKWMLQHLKDGVLKSARVDLAVGPENFDPDDPDRRVWPDDTMDVVFDFEAIEMSYFDGMPPITGAHGKGKIKGGLFQIDVEEAAMVTASGRHVKVDRLQYKIPDIRPRRRIARVEAVMSGPAPSLADLADSKPFSAMEKAGVKAEALSGDVVALFTASFDVDQDIQAEDLDWRLEASLSKFSSEEPINGRRIRNGDLNLVTNPREVKITGKANIDGFDLKLDMVEPLGDVKSEARRDVSFVLSEAERRRKGIDLAPLLTGPVRVFVDARGDDDQSFRIDLSRARLNIPVFGWTKGGQVPGVASFRVKTRGNSYEVSDIRVDAGGLKMSGKAVFGTKGNLRQATFSHFALRQGDDAALTIKMDRRGRLKATFKADNFDGRTLINSIKSGLRTAAGSKADFEIAGNIGRLTGFGDSVLKNGRFSAVSKAGHIEVLTLIGTNKGALALEMRPSPEGRKIDFSASDTGELLRFLDIYDRMRGGRARMQLTLDRGGRSVGRLSVRSFHIREDPALAKLIRTYGTSVRNSNDAMAAANSSVATNRNAFDRFDARFTYFNGMISVNRSRVTSPLIGATADGRIDLNRQVAAIRGTFLPVYGLNNIFGKIPILGQALGAGRHGGLVGITFKLVGPIDRPQLTVNPVSAVAPGILRKIFEYQ